MKFYWNKILNKAEDPGTEVAKLHDLLNVRSRVSDTSIDSSGCWEARRKTWRSNGKIIFG